MQRSWLEVATLAALIFAACSASAVDEPVEDQKVRLSRSISGQELREDLEQFRKTLKTQWMLSNLGNPDFDSAIDAIQRHADKGMTLAELALRLQKVLALGQDGHVGGLESAWRSVEGTRAGFTIDVCGDKYIAYLTEHLPHGPVNPDKKYRFRPLREGFPYVLAIDGLPIERWVQAASRFVPKGPPLAVRWASMMPLNHLPLMRRELGLPERDHIRLTLGSTDGTAQIDIDVPRGEHFLPPLLHVPQPDWRIIDDGIGYIWMPNMYGGTTKLLMQSMPKLRDTKGLVIDLRGNRGGGTEPLVVVASYLLPPDNPRAVVGQKFRWRGAEWKLTECFNSGTEGLSDDGKQFLRAALRAGGGDRPTGHLFHRASDPSARRRRLDARSA